MNDDLILSLGADLSNLITAYKKAEKETEILQKKIADMNVGDLSDSARDKIIAKYKSMLKQKESDTREHVNRINAIYAEAQKANLTSSLAGTLASKERIALEKITASKLQVEQVYQNKNQSMLEKAEENRLAKIQSSIDKEVNAKLEAARKEKQIAKETAEFEVLKAKAAVDETLRLLQETSDKHIAILNKNTKKKNDIADRDRKAEADALTLEAKQIIQNKEKEDRYFLELEKKKNSRELSLRKEALDKKKVLEEKYAFASNSDSTPKYDSKKSYTNTSSDYSYKPTIDSSEIKRQSKEMFASLDKDRIDSYKNSIQLMSNEEKESARYGFSTLQQKTKHIQNEVRLEKEAVDETTRYKKQALGLQAATAEKMSRGLSSRIASESRKTRTAILKNMTEVPSGVQELNKHYAELEKASKVSDNKITDSQKEEERKRVVLNQKAQKDKERIVSSGLKIIERIELKALSSRMALESKELLNFAKNNKHRVDGTKEANDAILRDYAKLQGEIKKKQHDISRSATGALGSETGTTFGHKMVTTSQYAVAGSIIYGVSAALRDAAKESMAFDDALYNNMSVLSMTSKEAESLAINSRQLSVALGGNIKDYDELALTLGRAGVENKDLIAATQSTAELAKITGDTLEKSSKVMSSFITNFKDMAKTVDNDGVKVKYTVDDIAESLAYMANATKMSTEDLGTFANYGLQTAQNMNLSLESTGAFAAMLSNLGKSASTVGTQMRKLDKLLMSNGDSYEKLFRILSNGTKTQQDYLKEIRLGGDEGQKALTKFMKSFADLNQADFDDAIRGLGIYEKELATSFRNGSDLFAKHLEKQKTALDLTTQATLKSLGATTMMERVYNAAIIGADGMVTSLLNLSTGREELVKLFEEYTKLQNNMKPTEEQELRLAEVHKILTGATSELNDKIGSLGAVLSGGGVALLIGALVTTVAGLPIAIAGAAAALGGLTAYLIHGASASNEIGKALTDAQIDIKLNAIGNSINYIEKQKANVKDDGFWDKLFSAKKLKDTNSDVAKLIRQSEELYALKKKIDAETSKKEGGEAKPAIIEWDELDKQLELGLIRMEKQGALEKELLNVKIERLKVEREEINQLAESTEKASKLLEITTKIEKLELQRDKPKNGSAKESKKEYDLDLLRLKVTQSRIEAELKGTIDASTRRELNNQLVQLEDQKVIAALEQYDLALKTDKLKGKEKTSEILTKEVALNEAIGNLNAKAAEEVMRQRQEKENIAQANEKLLSSERKLASLRGGDKETNFERIDRETESLKKKLEVETDLAKQKEIQVEINSKLIEKENEKIRQAEQLVQSQIAMNSTMSESISLNMSTIDTSDTLLGYTTRQSDGYIRQREEVQSLAIANLELEGSLMRQSDAYISAGVEAKALMDATQEAKEEMLELKNAFDDMDDLKISLEFDTLGLDDKLNTAVKSLEQYYNSTVDLMKIEKKRHSLKEKYDNDILDAGDDIEKQNKIEGKFLKDNRKLDEEKSSQELANIETLAGAAKGAFDEKTTAYKLLNAVEVGMHAGRMAMMAMELSSTLANAAAKWTEAGANATASVTAAGSGDPYTAPVRVAIMIGLMAAAMTMFGGGGGGGGGGGVPTTSTGFSFDQNREQIEGAYQPQIDRLDRQIELLESIDRNGSASKLGIEGAKLTSEMDTKVWVEDVLEKARQGFVDSGGVTADAIDAVNEAYGREVFISRGSKVAYNEDILRDSEALLATLITAAETGIYTGTLYQQAAIDAGYNWSNMLTYINIEIEKDISEFQAIISEWALGVVDSMNELKDASEDFKESYDSITGSMYYENKRLKEAFEDIDMLRGSDNFDVYLQNNIENIDKLDKALTGSIESLFGATLPASLQEYVDANASVFDTLLSQKTEDIPAQTAIIEELSKQTGLVFEGGAEGALNYLESIELVSEAMATSRENMDEFYDNFYAKDDYWLTKDLARAAGYQDSDVSTSMDELLKFTKVLEGGKDGLNDAETEFLQANLDLINSAIDAVDSTAEAYLPKANRSFSDVDAMLGGVSLTNYDDVLSTLDSAYETEKANIEEKFDIEKKMLTAQLKSVEDLAKFANDLRYDNQTSIARYKSSGRLLEVAISDFSEALAAGEDTSAIMSSITKYSKDYMSYAKMASSSDAEYNYAVSSLENKLKDVAGVEDLDNRGLAEQLEAKLTQSDELLQSALDGLGLVTLAKLDEIKNNFTSENISVDIRDLNTSVFGQLGELGELLGADNYTVKSLSALEGSLVDSITTNAIDIDALISAGELDTTYLSDKYGEYTTALGNTLGFDFGNSISEIDVTAQQDALVALGADTVDAVNAIEIPEVDLSLIDFTAVTSAVNAIEIPTPTSEDYSVIVEAIALIPQTDVSGVETINALGFSGLVVASDKNTIATTDVLDSMLKNDTLSAEWTVSTLDALAKTEIANRKDIVMALSAVNNTIISQSQQSSGVIVADLNRIVGAVTLETSRFESAISSQTLSIVNAVNSLSQNEAYSKEETLVRGIYDYFGFDAHQTDSSGYNYWVDALKNKNDSVDYSNIGDSIYNAGMDTMGVQNNDIITVLNQVKTEITSLKAELQSIKTSSATIATNTKTSRVVA